MAINIKIGEKTFRKAFYSDLVVFDVTFSTEKNYKSISVYVSSIYGIKGYVQEVRVPNYHKSTHLVTFEREMTEKEVLGYVKYISGITG